MTIEQLLSLMRSASPLRISREFLDGHPAYGRLLAGAATAGRCPVWIGDLGSLDVPDDPRAVLAEVGRRDPAKVLAQRWPGDCPCGCRAPFGERFPGLAPSPPPVDDAVAVAVRFAGEPWRSHLAVVPVARPADVVAAVGWLGTVNYHRDVAGLSAVLRSWEDRFGALLVRLDHATLWLSVAAPPLTVQKCLGVAA